MLKLLIALALIPVLAHAQEAVKWKGMIKVKGQTCSRHTFDRSPMTIRYLCYDDRAFYLCADEKDWGIEVTSDFFRFNSSSLKIDALPTPENIRVLEEVCREKYDLVTDGFKAIPYEEEREIKVTAETCPRWNNLPKIVATGEMHAYNLIYGRSRKALYALAANEKILFGSESGVGADTIQDYEIQNGLRWEKEEYARNFFTIESTAEWLVVASYKAMKELLLVEDVLKGREAKEHRDIPETASDHLVKLLDNPYGYAVLKQAFARSNLEARLPGGHETRLKLLELHGAFRPMRADFEGYMDSYTLSREIFRPFSLADRKKMLIEIHKIIISDYSSRFADKLSRMGISLPLWRTAEDVRSYAANPDSVGPTHRAQLRDRRNGEALVDAARSESFADAVAKKACRADARFSTVYVNMGRAHLDGFAIRLREMFGERLQFTSYDLMRSKEANAFMRVLKELSH